MSVSKYTYGIVGYDLTEYKDKIFTEENCESDWYEDLRCYQRVGKIQIFDDPMSRDYLYFGYIFFETDDSYENKLGFISLEKATEISDIVKEELFKYFNLQMKEPEIIVFNEFT